MRRLIEAMDSMSRAEKKPTGPKFPGYLKGTDPASKTRSKMVGGGCEQESVMTELAAIAKKKSTEWSLEEAFNQFKEAELPQGQFGRQFGDWSQKSAPDTTLPPGYGTPLPKLPDPVGDQSGGFKKVRPGEKFDPGPVIKPEKAIDLGPKYRGDGKGPAVQLPPVEPPPSELQNKDEAPVAQPPPAEPAPAKRELAGPADTFIKDKNGEWIENPANTTKPTTDISQSEMDDITKQMYPPVDSLPKPEHQNLAPAVQPAPVADTEFKSQVAAGPQGKTTPGPTPTQTALAPKPGSWQEIAQRNNISDPTKLRAGQVLDIGDGTALPNNTKYTVKPGDTLSGIAHSLRTNFIQPDQSGKQAPAPAAPAPAAPAPAPRLKKPPPLTNKDMGPNKSPMSGQRPDLQPEPESKVTPAPNIHSQAAQDAQWEKDKERMQGLLPNWLKGGSSSTNKSETPASTSSNSDVRKQADIAALKREISRQKPSQDPKEKTRLGILNKELAARQDSKNESLSQLLAKEFEMFLESDEPYPGYDLDAEKLKQRAKLGPMKTVWDEKTQRYRVVPVKPQEKQIKEYGNAQDPNQQTTNANQQQTSQTSNQQAIDQQVDISTAKSTMSGLKNVLGPQLNTNAAASGIVNMNDGKPLTTPEQQAISTLTPLMSKAAENPATATALKSALSTAGMLAKQGK